MNQEMEILVSNLTDHTYILDGHYFSSGSWKDDSPVEHLQAGPNYIYIRGTPSVSAVFWFVSQGDLDKYISVAITKNITGTIYFGAWAGLPPPDLKGELQKIEEVLHGRKTINEMPKGGSVEWIRNGTSAIHLKILGELPAYQGPVGTLDQSQVGPAKNTTFMDSSRPKNAWSGLKSGVGVLGKGAAGSIGILVGSTVVGAKEGGALGFAKGLGLGVVGGAAAAVGSVVAGGAQVARGVAQEFTAGKSRRDGKVWDQESGSWITIDLVSTLEKLLTEDSDDENEGGRSPRLAGQVEREVMDMEFYDILGVRSNADANGIKKAYYKKAREVHPDKHPNDPKAHENFQKLAEAYQILSDPELREKYDKYGKDGVIDSIQTLDPAIFFSILFGSEKFEGYTGTIQIASHAASIVQEVESQNAEGLARSATGVDKDFIARKKQWRREAKCSLFLRDKLERFVLGRNVEGFKEAITEEAKDLAKASHGCQLLNVLGNMYSTRAKLFIAEEMQGRYSLEKTRANANALGTKWSHRMSFAGELIDSAKQMRKITKDANKLQKQRLAEDKKKVDEETSLLASPSLSSSASQKPSEINGAGAGPSYTQNQNNLESEGGASGSTKETEAEKEEREAKQQADMEAATQKALEDSLPVFMRAAWAHTVLDLDSTVKIVCRNLLKDQSVPWQICIRRAQSLLILGNIFQEVAKSEAVNCTSATDAASNEKFREAMMGSIREKKGGQPKSSSGAN